GLEQVADAGVVHLPDVARHRITELHDRSLRGGATGTTSRSALALMGAGNRVRGAGDGGERDQATGTSGRVLPEEFRAGLDAYFNRFEKERR
ncbi:MAG: hypothetical protein ACKON7_12110, partial [Planctomycetaceae bacterium]